MFLETYLAQINLGDWGLLALRVAIGIIFIVHGTAKRSMWKMQPSEQMPAILLWLMRVLSVVEPLAGLAIWAGLMTRLAAMALTVVMLGALRYKILIWKTPFTANDKSGWEFDLILLAAAMVLVTMGAGALSLDRLF